MALTPEQREDALQIVKNSGGRLPVFHIKPPRPLDEMTKEERAMWATHVADETGAKIERYLQTVYDMALLKRHLPPDHNENHS